MSGFEWNYSILDWDKSFFVYILMMYSCRKSLEIHGLKLKKQNCLHYGYWYRLLQVTED